MLILKYDLSPPLTYFLIYSCFLNINVIATIKDTY